MYTFASCGASIHEGLSGLHWIVHLYYQYLEFKCNITSCSRKTHDKIKPLADIRYLWLQCIYCYAIEHSMANQYVWCVGVGLTINHAQFQYKPSCCLQSSYLLVLVDCQRELHLLQFTQVCFGDTVLIRQIHNIYLIPAPVDRTSGSAWLYKHLV